MYNKCSKFCGSHLFVARSSTKPGNAIKIIIVLLTNFLILINTLTGGLLEFLYALSIEALCLHSEASCFQSRI